MASNYFAISKRTNDLLVSPISTNDTHTDREAVITITNGGSSASVTVHQWGIPYFTLVGGGSSISAPANGGTYQIVVHTHYDIRFTTIPSWITIDDGQGNYIDTNTTVSKSTANGHTYNLTIAPNATNDDRSGTLVMSHYYASSIATATTSISITQPQGAEDYITIIGSSVLDWDDTNAKSIAVNANVQWTAELSDSTNFTLAGGNGYVTIRANSTNTGTTVRTTTIRIISQKASFPYTATCVVSQYRQPTISRNEDVVVPPTGGTKSVFVISDYEWWIPTTAPDSQNAYITFNAKTQGVNMSPTTGASYTLTWTANIGNTRNDNLYVGYLRADGSSTGQSASYANFKQENQAQEEIDVTPTRIPVNSTDYVSSGGGVYTVTVTVGDGVAWWLNNTPTFCVVSPTAGTGTTTVQVQVPAATSTNPRNDTLYFAINTSTGVAYKTVSVFQRGQYVEPAYIVVSPTSFNTTSAASRNQFTVSANTQWSAVVDDWMDLDTTTGGTGNTSHYFDVAVNTGSTRNGSIDFTPLGAGTALAHIYVEQAEGVVAVDAITLSSTGSTTGSGSSITQSITVTASNNWTLSTNVDWFSWYDSLVSQTPLTGGTSGTTTIYRRVEENSGSSRTGTTTFVCGTASATYTLRQNEAYVPPTYDDLLIEPEDDISTVPMVGLPSTGYSVYFENDGSNTEEWTIDYSEDNVHFYDGTDPNTSQQIDLIDNGITGYYYLHIGPTTTPRTITITFTGELSGRVKTLTIQQG